MISLSRQEIVRTSQLIVVKVGTNVLTADDGSLNRTRIFRLVDEICDLRNDGKEVILVSSGAVGAGVARLGLECRPSEHPKLQAVAAIGQSKLMQTYEEALTEHGVCAGQVLLTADDLSRRQQYLNVTNTFRSLLEYHALPIVNENDTVSVEELHSTFGDNDRLGALVANLFSEPLLILLTDVDGLYDGDPSESTSHLIPVVDRWTASLMDMVAEKRSNRSKGGMSSKLRAAKMVTASGGSVIIANGDDPDILTKIYAGEEVGTVFFPKRQLLARKRWLGFAVAPKGKLILDDGAVEALLNNGKSLLPIGVVDASGKFERGDVVSLVALDGKEIARGLSNYGTRDVLQIRRKKSSEIREILGHCPYVEIVSRDNIQLIE
ncbi:MAG: glutamate 5-kinase [Planctomycetia bacterium]|nr:glutamate 5-kinase [Planctomycetia bacterium]